MKKVGILVNSIGYGGNERSSVNIAKAISKQYDVSIIIQEDCGNHYGYGGRVINMNTPCADSTVGKVINSIRRIIRLRRIVREEQIDTLFIILPVSNPINYLKFRCKKIVSCRDCGDLMKRTEKYIEMTEKSDLIVCNSVEQTEYLIHKASHLADKAVSIYNILDIDKVLLLKEEPIEDDIKHFMEGCKCIISSGRFAKAKGWNNLLKAFKVLSQRQDNIRLILIGDGELKDKIKALIEELGIAEKVLLPGFQENPFKYISKADIFVLSSFYEGFPNTLVEAMACEKPVIATDCPSGPAEILQGTVNSEYKVTEYGVLVRNFQENKSTWQPNDIREEHVAFANVMDMLLNNSDLSDKMTKKAIERVHDFTAAKILSDWEKVL